MNVFFVQYYIMLTRKTDLCEKLSNVGGINNNLKV